MMTPPIIVNETEDPERGGDVSAFASIEDAADYLEAYDVDNNEYVAYDSLGRLLRLSTREGQVVIEPAETEPAHAAQLRSVLAQIIKKISVPEEKETGWLETVPLSDLVAMALQRLEIQYSPLNEKWSKAWQVLKRLWKR